MPKGPKRERGVAEPLAATDWDQETGRRASVRPCLEFRASQEGWKGQVTERNTITRVQMCTRQTGKHLLICTHFTTPLEQGDFGLALAVLVDELVEKGGDNRPLLQSRLAALAVRGHRGATARNHQAMRYAMKRGSNPSSRAGAGASARELQAQDGAEGQARRHGLCHGHRNKHDDSDRPIPNDKPTGIRHMLGRGCDWVDDV